MGKRLMLVCCVLCAALLWSAVVAHGAEIIDFAWTGIWWMVLDADGNIQYDQMLNQPEKICAAASYPTSTYPGAIALDCANCTLGPCVLAFPNGDLQPIDEYGNPDGALIPGPPGASGIEEVIIGSDCEYVIRSGCVFWQWDRWLWEGPCEPFSPGASEAEQESWSEIKAEFKD